MGKMIEELRAEFAHGWCLHPEAGPETCGRVIKAHTVQRRGGLSAIAENGHVISGKGGLEDIFKNDGAIIPREVGINHASTFMGFCDVHDNQLFAPVEKNPVQLDKLGAFLLSFRAICYEYLMKKTAFRTVEIQRQLDRGKDFETQCVIQQYLHLYRVGINRGLRDLSGWKQTYDNAYRAGNYEDFFFHAVLFAQPLPIVACGAFHPEFDFNGKALQIITRGTANFEHVCFNLTVINGKSVAVIGRTGQPEGPAEQFCNSFQALPKNVLANAAFHLVCEHLENTYFRASWWNAQSEEARKHLIARFLTGIGPSGPERKADCLSNFQFTFTSSDVEQELS